MVSECGLLKISVNETDTTTSDPVYIDLENLKKGALKIVRKRRGHTFFE
jgi:hypothetical protein